MNSPAYIVLNFEEFNFFKRLGISPKIAIISKH